MKKSLKEIIYTVLAVSVVVLALLFVDIGRDKEGTESSDPQPLSTDATLKEASVAGLMDSLNLQRYENPEPAFDFNLPALKGGGNVRLSEKRGKYVLLGFWSTW